MEYLILILFFVAMLPGIVGVLIPILPGVPYMFIVALVYALIDQFQKVTTTDIFILLGLAVLSLLVDYASGALGAKIGGASGKSTLGGMLGLIIGVILFPPFGGIIGVFLGILIVEMMIHKDQQRAIKVAKAGLIGNLAGIVINLLISLLFIALFVVFALK